jgi:hypothetical protein
MDNVAHFSEAQWANIKHVVKHLGRDADTVTVSGRSKDGPP